MGRAGRALESQALVIQYNKRDLPDAVPLERLQSALNSGHFPSVEACAAQGMGVLEVLDTLSSEVLRDFDAEEVASEPDRKRAFPQHISDRW